MIKEDWLRGRAQTLKGKAGKAWSRTSSWHKGGSLSPVKAADRHLDIIIIISWCWVEPLPVAVVATEPCQVPPSTCSPEQRERNEGEVGKNALYLENHYRIRELLQGVNKILSYSSSIQLILDSLKDEKDAPQCNRNYHHHLACR